MNPDRHTPPVAARTLALPVGWLSAVEELVGTGASGVACKYNLLGHKAAVIYFPDGRTLAVAAALAAARASR